MIYIIAIIVFLAIIKIYLRNINLFEILNPFLWLCISFSFLIITYLFSGLNYNTGSLYSILPYIIICFVLIFIGGKFGIEMRIPKIRKLNVNVRNLSLISIIGASILIFDLLKQNQISFGLRTEDQQLSMFGLIGTILSSFGIISWLDGYYNFRVNKVNMSLYTYLSFLSYISGGILSAGRSSLMIISVSSVIIFFVSKRKNKEVTLTKKNIKKRSSPVLFYTIIILVLSYFILISNIRSRIVDPNVKLSEFSKGFNATPSKQLIEDIDSFGFISHLYVEVIFYYSHELIRLDLLFKNYDYPPIFGLSQMGYIERRLTWLVGEQVLYSWIEVENALETKANFNSHTWGTFLSNFIMDFGRFGTLLACFILGVFFGLLRKSISLKNTRSKIIRNVIVCAGCIYSIQVSPVAELVWIIPLISMFYIQLKEELYTNL